MPKVIDVRKVQQALDRAALNAQRGSSDVRSGKFIHEAAFTARDFLVEDHLKTLFPLRTNAILFQYGFGTLLAFARQTFAGHPFLPQHHVSAMKNGSHLRRTVKLDPVAEVFLYDLVYRNRDAFQKPASRDRECFGYRFSDGRPINATSSYRAFKGASAEYLTIFGHGLALDVASYFNSIYLEDLVDWFGNRVSDKEDLKLFEKFLLETNPGRNVDCLPQGLYPSKMIGSEFLRFVDESSKLRSAKLVRFMDDIVFFSSDRAELQSDFYVVQELLGEKELSINSAKTRILDSDAAGEKVSAIRRELLWKRRLAAAAGYDNEIEEADVGHELSIDELSVLREMLSRSQLDEEDVELILALMGAYSSDVLERFGEVLADFPSLAKNMYVFSRSIRDREALCEVICRHVKATPVIPEYQLFWLGMMLDDFLLETRDAGDLLSSLYFHPTATAISKAKILEIPVRSFGLPDLREIELKSGRSDWLTWSAAVGTRHSSKAVRSGVLRDFRNASEMNGLIAEIVSDLP